MLSRDVVWVKRASPLKGQELSERTALMGSGWVF
jgi:hypothetical protein